jgi:soluble lytic murein transglycosylase
MTSLTIENLRRMEPRPLRWKRWAALFGVILLGVLAYLFITWVRFGQVLYKPLINKYAGEYKCDPLWVMAIIRVESRFASSARSARGAIGLMQILPSTARDIAPEIGRADFKEEDLKDPDTNLHFGIHYLSKLEKLFPDDETAILAAYNAGPGITQEWRRGKPALDLGDIAYPETRRFVQQVTRTYSLLKVVQRWKERLGLGP